ncbi:hypothetical protein P879_01631 [Paragonimus westermani]|uniref:Fibronectin type-III domain-containing protein n=1 Tax=Paragonimus westermani TaxID=34504 RepID=A0A8T0DQH7_9TREM|nr:hypothetical protein P879_01631 [Paragonimus westermani]
MIIRTPPSKPLYAPTKLRVEKITANSVRVSFAAIEGDGFELDQLPQGYQIHLACIDPPGCSEIRRNRHIQPAVNKSKIDNQSNLRQVTEQHWLQKTTPIIPEEFHGLSPYTLYEFRVAGFNAAGLGPFSSEVEVFRTKESGMKNTDPKIGIISKLSQYISKVFGLRPNENVKILGICQLVPNFGVNEP